MGSLPAETVATLALGLRDDSRVKMALRGEMLTFEQMMLVRQYDAIRIGNYLHTKDATKGRNRPKMMIELFEKKAPSEFQSFDTIEELNAAIERSKNV